MFSLSLDLLRSRSFFFPHRHLLRPSKIPPSPGKRHHSSKTHPSDIDGEKKNWPTSKKKKKKKQQQRTPPPTSPPSPSASPRRGSRPYAPCSRRAAPRPSPLRTGEGSTRSWSLWRASLRRRRRGDRQQEEEEHEERPRRRSGSCLLCSPGAPRRSPPRRRRRRPPRTERPPSSSASCASPRSGAGSRSSPAREVPPPWSSWRGRRTNC